MGLRFRRNQLLNIAFYSLRIEFEKNKLIKTCLERYFWSPACINSTSDDGHSVRMMGDEKFVWEYENINKMEMFSRSAVFTSVAVHNLKSKQIKSSLILLPFIPHCRTCKFHCFKRTSKVGRKKVFSFCIIYHAVKQLYTGPIDS